MKSLAVNVTATAYYQAEETYNALDLSFAWPSPYDLSEEERQVRFDQSHTNCCTCEGWLALVLRFHNTLGLILTLSEEEGRLD